MAQMTRTEVERVIIEVLKPLGVLRISLFGSFARNEETSQSDIDILVQLPPLENRVLIGLKWFSVDQDLESRLGRRVDLVSEDALIPALRKTIEPDLKVIYEKAG